MRNLVLVKDFYMKSPADDWEHINHQMGLHYQNRYSDGVDLIRVHLEDENLSVEKFKEIMHAIRAHPTDSMIEHNKNYNPRIFAIPLPNPCSPEGQ